MRAAVDRWVFFLVFFLEASLSLFFTFPGFSFVVGFCRRAPFPARVPVVVPVTSSYSSSTWVCAHDVVYLTWETALGGARPI